MKETVLHWKKAARTVLLVLLLSAAGTTNLMALNFTEGNLNYTVNEDGTSVTVTGHADGTSATGALDIPESVTHGAYTYAVTEILSSAFSGCTGLTTLTIPATMTFIGDYAFEDCSGLLILNYNAIDCSLGYYDYCNYSYRYRHWLYGCNSIVSLNIGENVQTIPNYFLGSYYGYSSFVGTLTIPNSVTSIGNYAFYGCSGFASVVIGNAVTTIGNYAFYGCYGFASVAFGNSMTTIGESAFCNCSNLSSVVIPETVISLGNDVFMGCTGLTSATIGNSVTSLGGTFSGCTSLSSVSIGNSVVSMGNSVFYGCTSLTSITIPNSVLSMGSYVFYECSNLASVTIGNSVVSIGDQVFKSCTSLASINIPASVVSIGTEIFSGCNALGQITVASGNPNYDSRDNCNAIIQTISGKLIAGCKNTVIPNTVVTIGERAFSGCSSLVGSLVIPSSVTSIEYCAFENCSGLVGALDLPNSVTSIGECAFSNCSGLTSVTIPASVTSIGKSAFSNCTNLVSLNYNAINCSIAVDYYNYIYSEHYYYNHWLEGCSSLVNLAIGENVQVIPDHFVYSRNGNSFIGALTIPNSVISIGFEAFYNCYGFSSVVIGNSVTSIDNEAFYGCSGLVTATIGNSVTNIGEKAFYACYGLTSITFGNSLTSIGNEAFYNCNDLSSVTFPNSVISIGNSAFSSCDGLASVEIGSSVVSIGNSAFSNCSNLSNIITHAETPPTLGSDAFYNVPTSISVYVPCESVEAYTSANWGGFTNIMGACAGEITVTANPSGAGMVSGAGSYEGGTSCTLTATSYGYLPFLNWTKDGEVVSTNPTYSFIVTGDASYVANFGQVNVEDFQIGSGTATNQNLPSNSYYDYTLSQQIYTAGEMGGMAGTISSIAFYNGGSEKTRSYDIYLKHTTKSSFSNNSDWITVSASDKVFSGDVTMVVGDWTTITFDTPFTYDGVSNLALIVDDNTGSWSQGMACRVFDAEGNQAIYKYDDNTNFDPSNPSGISGTRLSVKNQIKLGFTSMLGSNITFADDAVKALCVANWDTDGDGELSYVEAAAVTDLGTVFKNTTITSFDELQYFTGLTSIESETFYSCSNLVSVQIPVTVETVESRAFTFCSNLTSITIPSSVTNMGSAFTFCPGLEQIVVAEGNTTYDSRNGCNAVIETATNKLVSGCRNTVIPNGITVIGTAAFAGHSTLLSINFPNTLTTIMLDAFIGCHSLNEIALPNALTTIGFNAFESCRSLTSLTLPASVTSLASTAFEGCSGMGSIVVEDGNTVYDSRNSCNAVIETATNALVSGCKNTIIPESVVAIGNSAFSGHSGLVSIEIPDAVTSIGVRAFAQCSGLASIDIPEGVTSIGNGAFQTCSSLTSLVIPDLVSSIEEYAFNWCDNLRSVTLGSSVATIEEHAFSHCTMLDYMAIRAEVPPTINGSQTFYEVPTNLTVYVPCGHENAYASISWGGFSNFVGMCPVEITATANPTAGGTVAGAGTYDHGATATLTATANTGYTFVNWTKDGTVVSTNATYSFTVLEGAAYVANFSLNSYAITATSNPTAGGTVAGAGTYDHGTTATLTATANTGYTFVNWTKDGTVVSTNATYSFTVLEGAAYVANFSLNSYAITATANPTTGGTVTGAGTYDHGTTATLTATANTGYTFVNWTKDGAVVSTNATYSFTVTEVSDFVANFALNSYEVTTMASPTEGGVTTGTGTYDHGTTVTLTATANVGYTFINWTLDGEEVSTNITYTFTVTEASAFVANFALNSYEVTVEASPSEGGTATGGGTFDHFTTCTLTATANEAYSFVNWTKDGTVVSTNATYSFTVLESAAFVANFELNSYAITATANPTIGGTVTGGGTYYHFETATLTAIANEGYHFVNWTKGGEVVSSIQTYSFEVTESADFVANFAVNAYNVFAMANPSVGGTVTGAGAYEFGETATLTATPNANYAFVNWAENGVEVSTEAIYSFTVEGSRNLVANFSHDYYWTVNPFAHESTMTIIGIVQINGEEQHSNLLEVGAFSGEECRGREWLTDQYYVDLGHYLVFLTIYGDDDSADEITFRLYDHAVGEEIDKTCVTTLFFETDAIYGSNTDPFALNFIDENVAQTTNFNNGWNWWSSFIELDGANSLQSLENSLGTNGMMIKSQNDGYASYLEGFGWYGSLTTINNESTYQIRANEACTVEMTGSIANPAEHPVELHSGWTWVGYPVAVSMGVEDALAGIEPLSGDMLKSQNNGFASYLEGFGWYGSLSILNPGMGLMYKSNNSSNITLTYPNGGTRTDLKPNQTSENNHWQPNLNAYPDNMSVMAVVELDGNELEGENYELAAFANGEVRGSARLLYVEPLNRYMAFLTVAGDEAAELRFGLYNTETGEECIDSDNVITYVTNAVVGSFAEPYVVSFRGATGVDEWANSLNVYPNPVQRGQNVTFGSNDVETSKMRVEIINALGAIVETWRATSLQTITAPETAGVYTLRVTLEGKGTCYRKLVVR